MKIRYQVKTFTYPYNADVIKIFVRLNYKIQQQSILIAQRIELILMRGNMFLK